MADLVYSDKEITLNVGETYALDKEKLQYINQKQTQTGVVSVGEVEFEVLDTDVATIDGNKFLTGNKVGKTKIKVTDKTNGISTYIYLNIINKVKVDIQEGTNFTVALKENGTVWSYGLNTSGELGIGNNENKLIPSKVEGLSNIKAISTGATHALALTEKGEVYAWGAGTNGQLGDGENKNSNKPVKVDGLSNIIKIDAYKNISIALDNEGKVYAWGQGYSVLPTRQMFSGKVVDISGNLILAEDGNVYTLSNLNTPISGLVNIAKISAGSAHNLALSVFGTVYSWGTNTYGECGTATTGNRGVSEIGCNVREISAGNCTSIMLTDNNKLYVLGNNANGQIGLGSTAKATASTGVTVNTTIESISAGEGTHMGIIAEDGFVWHTGTNNNGQLGIGNTTNKNVFTKTGDTVIKIDNEDTIYLDLNEVVTLRCTLENTYNLKVDLIDDVQNNFGLTLSNNNSVDLVNKTFTAKQYGNTKVTIRHTSTGKTKEISIIVVFKMESIVQGFRDADLPDGNYDVLINGETYNVELINIEGDTTYTENVSLGDDSTQNKTLVVKYHGDLTIEKGVTVTAKTVNGLTYKKGMYLCVLGDIHNNGTISMTARGTYSTEDISQDVFLWKNTDDSYEYVPKNGAPGREAFTTSYQHGATSGLDGKLGNGRQTGGGGQGNFINNGQKGAAGSWMGASTGGTSYGGGNGSGSFIRCNTSALAANVTEASKTNGRKWLCL